MIDMDVVNAALVRSRTDPESFAAGQASNAKNAKKTELNQQDFLALMVAQLKNQDPFKPMDPSQYVGQLAQFSSVSGLSEMNTQLTNLTSSLRGNQVLDGANLIGRTVIAPGKEIYLDGADNENRILPQGMVDVPAGAQSVQLVIKDSTGQLVKSVALDPSRGPTGFSWDGTTNAGANAAPGTYKIEVIAKVGNENVSLATSVAAHVSSVSLDPTTGSLMLTTDPLGDVEMKNVERVL
ncbi:MAG TPA: flagellar hook assembly protein FlgD [Steroidobacteraceae bacterium]|nr:flagellar hook assembly protein FlgD [Steroidobacteraceae bacterium]